jgi:hypothetical protein
MDDDKQRILFNRLYGQLREWNVGEVGLRNKYLGWLFRGEDANIFFNDVEQPTDEELLWCEMLLSENGYAVLKILEARRAADGTI